MACKTTYVRVHHPERSPFAGVENYSDSCKDALKRIHLLKPSEATTKITIVKEKVAGAEGYTASYEQVSNHIFEQLLKCAIKSRNEAEYRACSDSAFKTFDMLKK